MVICFKYLFWFWLTFFLNIRLVNSIFGIYLIAGLKFGWWVGNSVEGFKDHLSEWGIVYSGVSEVKVALPVCAIPLGVSWERRRRRWPGRTGPSGRRWRKRWERWCGTRSSSWCNRPSDRSSPAACPSWCRSNCRPWPPGTASRKQFQSWQSERARPVPGTDGRRRTLDRRNMAIKHTKHFIPVGRGGSLIFLFCL